MKREQHVEAMNKFVTRYAVWFSLCAVPSLAADSPCLVVAPAEPPTGMATWSKAGRDQRHALIYLAGEYPEGFPFRTQIKDKDVDKIRAKGTRVLILDPHYTRDDLEKARKQCGINAGSSAPAAAPPSAK